MQIEISDCNSGFSEEILFWGKRAILGLNMVRPDNFADFLLKFSTMKGAKKYLEIILMVFRKAISFRANGQF